MLALRSEDVDSEWDFMPQRNREQAARDIERGCDMIAVSLLHVFILRFCSCLMDASAVPAGSDLAGTDRSSDRQSAIATPASCCMFCRYDRYG